MTLRIGTLWRFVIVTALLAVSFVSLWGQFGGGDGTAANPYQVASAVHLNNVRNHLNAHFIQTETINLNTPPYNEGEGWLPIGHQSDNPFMGVYNGGGKVIRGLTINRNADDQALFGFLGIWSENVGSGIIRNLGLIDVNINSPENNFIAGIAARIHNQSIIERCFVTGTIRGRNHVGGINARKGCNMQSTHIYDCYSTAQLFATFNSANVTVGGITAEQYRGSTLRVYATGPIIIVDGTQEHYARVAAVMGYRSGGTTANFYWNNETTLVANRIGVNHGPGGVHTEYPGNTTAELRRQETYPGFAFPAVWMINEGNSYPFFAWQEEAGAHNTQIPFLLPPRNITGQGRNNAIMLTWNAPSVGEPDGYNIYRAGQRMNQNPVVVREFLDTGLPNFQVFRYTATAIYDDEESRHSYAVNATSGALAGGTGTPEDPYLIATVEHLATALRQFPTAHFRQIEDINLNVPPYNQGQGWEPIGSVAPNFDNATNPFRGTYDGNFKKISGLFINRTGVSVRNQGLFAIVNNATLKNIILENTDIRGYTISGGITGTQTGGTISQCYVSGSVRGQGTIGGIAGYSTGTIINSVNMAHPAAINTAGAGRGTVGGILGSGSNAARITNSYSAGQVSCRDGNHSGLVHNANPVVTNSYWDIEASGVPTSLGGEGRTSSQLTRQATFIEWDFEDVWQIRQGTTYPFFRGLEEPFDGGFPAPAPSSLIAFASADRQITLEWEAPSVQCRNIRIFRNNVHIHTVDAAIVRYVDGNLSNNTLYTYYLIADHGDNRLSNPSPAVQATPVAGGFAGGRGISEDPYLVATPQHLDHVRRNRFASYRQVTDIDLNVPPYNAGAGWEPIGRSAAATYFGGSYNGGGFRITGMRVLRPTETHCGLFGYIIGETVGLTPGTFQNIFLEDFLVQGRQYIGGLFGFIDRNAAITVRNVRIDGEIEVHGTTASQYAGGMVGRAYNNSAGRENIFINCSTHGSIVSLEEYDYLAGFNAYCYRNIYQDCYSTMSVTGRNHLSAFIAYGGVGRFTRCYAAGRVSGEGDSVFGFATRGTATAIGTAANCYWDTEATGQEFPGTNTPGITGHTTAQMTFPYRMEDIYINWDFEAIWVHDEEGNVNNGYPYLFFETQTPDRDPDIAGNPQPQHQAANVPVNLQELSWAYTQTPHFANPVGFRVYFNATGQFGDDHEFVWVEFDDEEENYAASDILPEEGLDYLTTYYWKVVPTTNAPEGRSAGRARRSSLLTTRHSPLSLRGDAQNVPVWRFTTEIYPNPVTASNPQPQDEAAGISLTLNQLSWSFTPHQDHSNPVGFRVYLNTDGEFEEEDDFAWVAYIANQTNYANSSILPEELDYNQTYYWKVIPTTNVPEGRSAGRARRSSLLTTRHSQLSLRGDAQNVPVWSFTTIASEDYPQPPANPQPEHLAAGVSLDLERVSWQYHQHENFTNPVGFRVYMNTTGSFGINAPYQWVDYDDEETDYSASEIIPHPLDPDTIYYWRVVPTTDIPEDLRRDVARNASKLRGDAPNSPVWRFTTATTATEKNDLPLTVTAIHGSFPNPFNPHTTVLFSLAADADVELAIYNTRGQLVRTLINEFCRRGEHQVHWNGLAENGDEVPSGVYFSILKTPHHRTTGKMLLLR